MCCTFIAQGNVASDPQGAADSQPSGEGFGLTDRLPCIDARPDDALCSDTLGRFFGFAHDVGPLRKVVQRNEPDLQWRSGSRPKVAARALN
jgi:hypothetical protein